MSSPVNYPIYPSYVCQHEQYTIFTQQATAWNGDLSLFSTVISPGRPTKHCWTSGTTHGCEYRIQTEYSTPSEPGRGNIYPSSIFIPAFSYQLSILCPDATAPFIPNNISEFDSSLYPPTPRVGPCPLPENVPSYPPGSDHPRQPHPFIPCGITNTFSGT